jgi:putative ABC transport system permease protein
MRIVDVVGTAVNNSFRSKLRTSLTVVAIFIGAFTLTITNGLGTGINRYIDDTVGAIGASDVLTVTKTPEDQTSTGPKEYDPSLVVNGLQQGPPGSNVSLVMTSDDIDTISAVDGVVAVEPSLALSSDYVQFDGGTQYQVSVISSTSGLLLQLADGDQPNSETTELQVALPTAFVEPLGFSTNSEALGSIVAFGVTDAEGGTHVIQATVVGISETGLGTTDTATANEALTTTIFDAQSIGLSAAAKESFAQAVVRFDPASTTEQIDALKSRLTDAGFTGRTVADQIGAFKTVVDVIVLILNAFAVIALLAASFGIVNTLLMSVQERTREIGLMKAMGMGSGRIFGLFSVEAVFIGFLGSALGSGIGIIAGTAISAAVGESLFSGLPGLQLIAFDPASIGIIIAIVMGIAFLAGTLPASRAARQDPIESLRYE